MYLDFRTCGLTLRMSSSAWSIGAWQDRASCAEVDTTFTHRRSRALLIWLESLVDVARELGDVVSAGVAAFAMVMRAVLPEAALPLMGLGGVVSPVAAQAEKPGCASRLGLLAGACDGLVKGDIRLTS